MLSAGNINTTLPDYSLYIQNYLKGLEGKGIPFKKETFEQLLFQFPIFLLVGSKKQEKMEKVILIILEMPTVLCPPYQYLKRKKLLSLFSAIYLQSQQMKE
ncbi:hypothetical protein [Chryseobacterium bernardetii]|uniref:hypothetical protein n=1 Tax=Chryseobacterium bernardetii TaxID=1241978 RepID=UPI000F4F7AB0|nr:hypothetical protein [Chryseobacterium bernardetii]AZB32310.1 hypothetical protein EG351_00750 [Chryseobacterium bernardetii]